MPEAKKLCEGSLRGRVIRVANALAELEMAKNRRAEPLEIKETNGPF